MNQRKLVKNKDLARYRILQKMIRHNIHDVKEMKLSNECKEREELNINNDYPTARIYKQ